MTNEELANELAGRVGALRDAHMPTTAAVVEEAAARLRQQSEDSARLDWLDSYGVAIVSTTDTGTFAFDYWSDGETLTVECEGLRDGIDKARNND